MLDLMVAARLTRAPERASRRAAVLPAGPAPRTIASWVVVITTV